MNEENKLKTKEYFITKIGEVSLKKNFLVNILSFLLMKLILIYMIYFYYAKKSCIIMLQICIIHRIH